MEAVGCRGVRKVRKMNPSLTTLLGPLAAACVCSNGRACSRCVPVRRRQDDAGPRPAVRGAEAPGDPAEGDGEQAAPGRHHGGHLEVLRQHGERGEVRKRSGARPLRRAGPRGRSRLTTRGLGGGAVSPRGASGAEPSHRAGPRGRSRLTARALGGGAVSPRGP